MSAVQGGVRTTLRVEGLAIFVLCMVLYGYYGAGWLLFAVLFLMPDLSFLMYLAGPTPGAVAYNAVHTYTGPVALWLAGAVFDARWATAVAFTWGAHIGIDRALGYGLKYSSGFRETHLGALGETPG